LHASIDFRFANAARRGRIRKDLCIPASTSGFIPSSAREETTMAESVYKVVELIGSSTESWEKAAAAAIETAAKSLRDLRVAEIAELDLQLEEGEIRAYRAKVKVSFKYHA